MDKRYNKFKPKKGSRYSYGTMDNKNKPQDNQKAEKSAEQIYNLMDEECPFVIHPSVKPYVIEAMNLYANPLQSRIAELEKQNAELLRDKEIVDFIMKVDWMGTKEFCEFAGHPTPYFHADRTPAEHAQDFIRVDMLRWKNVIDFAKKQRREQALKHKDNE